MTAMDIVILVLTIVLVLSIIFFSLILPKIKHEKIGCSSCPQVKKMKRMFKNLDKENDNK